MIARSVRARSGITLTEILISILIMGIGLVSLATLFPLGLIRLRDAARFQRGGMLAQSATDDIDARALLYKFSFSQTWYGTRDPFTLDATFGGFANPVQTGPIGPNPPTKPLPGLMVCYDPLWFSLTHVVPLNPNANNALYDGTLTFAPGTTYTAAEARFGSGIPFNLGSIGSGSQDAGRPSTFGLQRITNFIPWNANNYTPLYPFTYSGPGIDVAGDTFTSIDDIVFNSVETAASGAAGAVNQAGVKINFSPLLPDLSLSGNNLPSNDYKYSWLFTGRQVDSTNSTMFQGDVVISDSRQFSFAALPGGTTPVAGGETVVEGIFGYSTSIVQNTAVGADRTVLLRWPATNTDPQVRIGGWIADVTYERDFTTNNTRINYLTKTLGVNSSFQRCNWYQVVKRTDPQPDPDFATCRRMIVTISSPVRTKTALGTGGLPVFMNTALVMPSVINVYPRTFTVHKPGN